MLRGANIVCLASIDWSNNWQLHQEAATAFAAAGNRVLFVDNTGVRRPGLRDAGRLWDRLRAWSHGLAHPETRVDVLSPLLAPFPYSPLATRANAALLFRSIRRWIRRDANRPLIVLTYLPTPLMHRVIDALDPLLLVYYRADLLSESSPGARPLHAYEESMLARADLVFTTAASLRATAHGLAQRVEHLETGVRFVDFANARDRVSRAPAVFEGISGPVVGFTGTLRDALDLALLANAARLAPELTFVLAGPATVDVRQLASLPNVRLVGPIEHADVIEHMAWFDAGILPYALNPFTASIMPMKLMEYLAAGLPVVSTRLPEVCRFAEEHGGVVTFADDAMELVAALRAAVREESPEELARRMEVARRHDWSAQMASMSELMEEALAGKAAAR